ncbi:hypothetical protein Agub_g8817, partial [Astrephomene gubernaculifera]
MLGLFVVVPPVPPVLALPAANTIRRSVSHVYAIAQRSIVSNLNNQKGRRATTITQFHYSSGHSPALPLPPFTSAFEGAYKRSQFTPLSASPYSPIGPAAAGHQTSTMRLTKLMSSAGTSCHRTASHASSLHSSLAPKATPAALLTLQRGYCSSASSATSPAAASKAQAPSANPRRQEKTSTPSSTPAIQPPPQPPTASPAPLPRLSELAAGGAELLSDEALKALGVRLPSHCCGCGMRLQRRDPEAPGFFIVPSRLLEARLEEQAEQQQQQGPAAAAAAGEQEAEREEAEQLRVLEAARREMDEDAEADVASLGPGRGEDDPDVLCQRCFSLKHSGKIKVQALESALPEFDLGKKVGRKIHLQKDRRAVVLCVVDVWDFDGSLPRLAIKSLFPPSPPDQPPLEPKFRLMVAVNKFDLLPSQATPTRVQNWVRTRLVQAGLPPPDKVFMVSATRGLGVKDMVQDIRHALGFRGDLWVVGAQNAGKSSLIAAMKRLAGTAGKGDPTVAPVPGTTLGLLQVPGLPLGPKHRAFDTPGVPHSHQLTSHLGLEEVKKVLPSKPLRGRTYRVGAGHTLLLGGGLARLDVVEAPGATLYLTAFVSQLVHLHMGKTEGAAERLPRLVSQGLLSPPDSPERLAALPPLTPIDVEVEGSDWKKSTVDIAVAGLGWVGVGCKGRARFRLWTLPGVAVTTHAALVPDYAEVFERPGLSTLLPKAQSKEHKAK